MANHSYTHLVDRDVCRVCHLERRIVDGPVAGVSAQPASRSRRTWKALGRMFENEPRCSTVRKMAAEAPN